MIRWLRISLLAAVGLVTSCVGGPVSDLPHSGDPRGPKPSDEGDDSSFGGLDAGTATGLDAGIPSTALQDGGEVPCDDASTSPDGS